MSGVLTELLEPLGLLLAATLLFFAATSLLLPSPVRLLAFDSLPVDPRDKGFRADDDGADLVLELLSLALRPVRLGVAEGARLRWLSAAAVRRDREAFRGPRKRRISDRRRILGL